eukprot:jgi/Mesen1/8558/ME000489S07942
MSVPGVLIDCWRYPHPGAREGGQVTLISQLHHVNLVALLGFCTDDAQQIFVYEYVPGGTLSEWLRAPAAAAVGKEGEKRRGPLTFEQRLTIAVGTARSLDYLHTCHAEPLIHRDVKPDNILLDAALRAKVADFGLMKRFNKEEEEKKNPYQTRVAGTPGYMDPEYYTSGQLMTGQRAVVKDPHDKYSEPKTLAAWVKSQVDGGGGWESAVDPRMQEYPRDAMVLVLQLALECQQLHGVDRPTMKEVCSCLEEIASHTDVDLGQVAPSTPTPTGAVGSGQLTHGDIEIVGTGSHAQRGSAGAGVGWCQVAQGAGADAVDYGQLLPSPAPFPSHSPALASPSVLLRFRGFGAQPDYSHSYDYQAGPDEVHSDKSEPLSRSGPHPMEMKTYGRIDSDVIPR